VIPVKTKQPEEQKVYPIAIIGAGAGGTMAVKRAVLNNHEVLLFAGAIPERRGSRGYWVRTVDNIPGLEKYERTILQLRNEALEDLVQGPLGHQLYIIEDSVQTIKKEADFFSLTDGSGHTYYAKYVVMATGMMDEQPHIQGSIRPILDFANGQTVAYCALCDGHRAVGKQTVVIGHSESAASVALLLVDKYQPTSMTILTNGQTPDFTPGLRSASKTKISLSRNSRFSKFSETELSSSFLDSSWKVERL
jgi:thioredoxin reductase (NADPH)